MKLRSLTRIADAEGGESLSAGYTKVLDQIEDYILAWNNDEDLPRSQKIDVSALKGIVTSITLRITNEADDGILMTATVPNDTPIKQSVYSVRQADAALRRYIPELSVIPARYGTKAEEEREWDRRYKSSDSHEGFTANITSRDLNELSSFITEWTERLKKDPDIDRYNAEPVDDEFTTESGELVWMQLEYEAGSFHIYIDFNGEDYSEWFQYRARKAAAKEALEWFKSVGANQPADSKRTKPSSSKRSATKGRSRTSPGKMTDARKATFRKRLNDTDDTDGVIEAAKEELQVSDPASVIEVVIEVLDEVISNLTNKEQ